MIACSKKTTETKTKQTYREESTVEGKIKGKERENEMLGENKVMGLMKKILGR